MPERAYILPEKAGREHNYNDLNITMTCYIIYIT